MTIQICQECGQEILKRVGNVKYCLNCLHDPEKTRNRYKRKKNIPNGNDKARSITNHAVRIGFLNHPKELTCVDCGKQAECYDHRDYNQPLAVDAVCLRCNSSRAKGIPFLASPSK